MASADQSRSPDTRGVSGDIGYSTGRYLLAVYWLSQDRSHRVGMGELADALDVSGASVSEMVRTLDERGFVDYEKYQGVELTRTGRDAATRIAWRFCVVTNFFNSVLDADLDDETSYEIGATLPEDGVFRLRQLVDHPCIEECPETAQADDGRHL